MEQIQNQQNDKYFIHYDQKNKYYILKTKFGSLKFNDIIGYHRDNKHNKFKLLSLFNNNLIEFDLDVSLFNSAEFIESINQIISNKIISNVSNTSNMSNEDVTSKPKKILDLSINSDSKNANIKIYHFENIDTYLLINDYGTIIFDQFIGYNNNGNNNNDNNDITLICCYNSHIIYFKLHCIFSNCLKLHNIFDNLLSK